MAIAILTGSPDIEVVLRPSARARRLSLRISRLDGRVTLSMPLRVGRSEALRFAREKESWIRKTLATQAAPRRVEIGGQVPLRGAMMTITAHDKRRVVAADGHLFVPADPTMVVARVQAYLKVQARLDLARSSDHYAALVGRAVHGLSLRDTRSRWGSCSTAGQLMYSWRLIMAPPSVLDYVAAHEVAHLVEMNHSSAFWDVVCGLMPDWQRQRDWLRDHGGGLHAYRFSAPTGDALGAQTMTEGLR